MLMEELHWLLLISGHLLTSSTTSGNDKTAQREPPVLSIPREFALIQEASDAVVNISSCVFGLAQFYVSCLNTYSNEGVVSPLVGETIQWWLGQWGRTYLPMAHHLHTHARHPHHLPEKLVQTYREDGAVFPRVLEVYVTTICGIMTCPAVEPPLVQQACKLLVALSKLPRSNAAAVVLASGSWQSLCQAYVTKNGSLCQKFTPDIHRIFFESLVRIISAGPNPETLRTQFELILRPVESEFLELVGGRADFASVAQQTNVIARLVRLLHTLRGLAEAGREVEGQKQAKLELPIFQFLSKFFDKIGALVHIYKDRREITLEFIHFYYDLALYLLPGLGDAAAVETLLGAFLNFFKIYAQTIQSNLFNLYFVVDDWGVDRATHVSQLEAENEERERYDHLKLLLGLLSLLADTFLFGVHASLHSGPSPAKHARDLVFFGIGCLQPLFTQQMLQVRVFHF
jgi:hypothetical protein